MERHLGKEASQNVEQIVRWTPKNINAEVGNALKKRSLNFTNILKTDIQINKIIYMIRLPDDEFKQLRVDNSDLICPEKRSVWKILSLSPCCCKANHKNCREFSRTTKKVKRVILISSLAFDESSKTARLLIYIKWITRDFMLTAAWQFMKGTTTGEDLLGEIKKNFAN